MMVGRLRGEYSSDSHVRRRKKYSSNALICPFYLLSRNRNLDLTYLKKIESKAWIVSSSDLREFRKSKKKSTYFRKIMMLICIRGWESWFLGLITVIQFSSDWQKDREILFQKFRSSIFRKKILRLTRKK